MGKNNFNKITFEMVKSKIPLRNPKFNKGNFGKLLCVCGSKEMPGAAYFCTSAAVRCGVGLVKAAVVPSVYKSLSVKISEPTFCILNESKDGFIFESSLGKILKELQNCSAVLIGCGMGWNAHTKRIVYELIRNSSIPMLIDADGINVISENINILKEAKAPVVITPHVKEFSRLINKGVDFILENKLKCVAEFSKQYKVITVFKDYETVISDLSGNIYLNTTGNVGMAKGGSGDVLSGIVASFLAQNFSPIDAAVCGVHIHGKSGDECSKKNSEISMLPTDLVANLPNVFLKLE